MIQGGKKFKAGTRAPEDSSYASDKQAQSFSLNKLNDTPQEKITALAEMRWNRIVMNDLENIPLGLILCWASELSGNQINNIRWKPPIKQTILSSF
jgi:glutathione S-transferase